MQGSPKGSVGLVVGEPLSGVAFVQTYVEFHFDGKVIRALTRPIVVTNSASLVFPEPGSRDAMCALIGQAVERVTFHSDIDVEVQFSGGVRIVIPLVSDEHSGPEVMHFVPAFGGPIEVW